MIIILGANVLAAGITFTTHDTIAQSWLQQTVGNATVYNTTSSIVSGFTDILTTWKDIYTNSIGIFLLLFAVSTIYLTLLSLMKGFEEERSEE